MIIIFREPGANIIDTVTESGRSRRSRLHSQSIDVKVAMDQTITIAPPSGHEDPAILCSWYSRGVLFSRARGRPSSRVSPCRCRCWAFVREVLRLQPRQSVTDGADHLHRLCRHDADRGHRERDALSRNRALVRSTRRSRAQEVSSTVFTISVSLVAVFIPLLLMGGIVGRLFRPRVRVTLRWRSRCRW